MAATETREGTPQNSQDDQIVVDTIRTLAMDAVQKASSGHPGMPMGMADVATVLWRRHLSVDPAAPGFPDRDRFVLSAGHGSMLQYALLHLAGFDLPLDELKNFRQLHSRTPGHPEVHVTPGVETTTGPLGQGITNSVGMALAEAHLAAVFNRPGFPVVDHRTWAICSDGDLHEGISHEAAALAGHLGLHKLVWLYDDNAITIDGSTSLSDSQDATKRFEAYGWNVLEVDGHDRAAVEAAIEAAKAEQDRPTLIRCHTHIGHGSPNKQDSASSHGSPLGVDEVAATKRAIGWPEDAHFRVPDAARGAFAGLRERGAERRREWEAMFARYESEHLDLAAEWRRRFDGDGLPEDVEAALPSFDGAGSQATRATSGKVINALAPVVGAFVGGSADLTGSNKTDIKGGGTLTRGEYGGRNIHYGVREHGMAGIMNGMALHGGIIPFGGTFLTFTDYMRGSMRLSALMKQRVVYVLTHDSIFLGEDGPTHQSIEHAMALRLIPDMHVMRPADGAETAGAWLAALRRTDGPTCLLLTRQGIPQLASQAAAIEGTARGAYVLRDGGDSPDVVLIGTGSELHLCVDAAETLAGEGIAARVVSMPCMERFLAQDAAYRDQVLPPSCPKRVSVEAGRTFGWQAIVGAEGRCVGIDRFGESAPAEELAELFGFTAAHVAEVARELVG